MIITRTPFRISLAGGGTDLAEFYAREEGAVVSFAIDKYMYITVHPRFEKTIRVSYSKTEIVDRPDDLEHPIVREALKTTGIDSHIEIISMADIPANTGLGSSSSFTVGLLHALWSYKGKRVGAEDLARQACAIEIERLKEPIGKQDQYIAAYGNLRQIRFLPNGLVRTKALSVKPAVRRALADNLLVFYTDMTRRASDILSEQKRQTADKMSVLKAMRDMADELARVLEKGQKLDRVGEILDQSWALKKSLAPGITNPRIEELYDDARKAGAIGGKILGAGGGGFLLLYAARGRQGAVRRALSSLRPLTFALEPRGSVIAHRN